MRRAAEAFPQTIATRAIMARLVSDQSAGAKAGLRRLMPTAAVALIAAALAKEWARRGKTEETEDTD